MHKITLTPEQRIQLEKAVGCHPKPYSRERAAAVLKVANGTPAAAVARGGLLVSRKPDTLYRWIERFEKEGIEGLNIRKGRGRKPAFSP